MNSGHSKSSSSSLSLDGKGSAGSPAGLNAVGKIAGTPRGSTARFFSSGGSSSRLLRVTGLGEGLKLYQTSRTASTKASSRSLKVCLRRSLFIKTLYTNSTPPRSVPKVAAVVISIPHLEALDFSFYLIWIGRYDSCCQVEAGCYMSEEGGGVWLRGRPPASYNFRRSAQS